MALVTKPAGLSYETADAGCETTDVGYKTADVGYETHCRWLRNLLAFVTKPAGQLTKGLTDAL